VILANGLVSVWFAGWIAERFPDPTPVAEYLDCFRYGLNLYLQFAGFSDVAIGFGLLLGFRIAENFRSPFLAPNIAEFWRRWHITLSSWCRDYVYMPVAASTRRPVPAILAAMLVLGLWHELSPRFLAWGLYHGAGIAVFRVFDRARPALRVTRSQTGRLLVKGLAVFLTLNFVMLSFVITKERGLGAAFGVYKVMFLGLVGG
jgi:D-alanyl-lipoteichoic acid acyltransferase DltB (MBOAT superfamily)